MDQLPRLGKRELICLLSFACNYVVFVWRSFLFLWVLGMGYVILLWHSLSLPYNYLENISPCCEINEIMFESCGDSFVYSSIKEQFRLFSTLTTGSQRSLLTTRRPS